MVAANKEATLLSSHDLFNRCGVSISQMTTICSVCHNHNPVLSSFMINHRSCNKIPSIDHGNKYYRMIWVIRPVSYKKHDMLILGKHPGFWWGPCFSFFSFLCCIFLWIVHSWLPLQLSLIFIYCILRRNTIKMYALFKPYWIVYIYFDF